MTDENVIFEIAIDEIKPGKRSRTDFGNLDELADSIKRKGQLQPICVEDDLTLIWGERRLRAAKIAGLTKMKAIFKRNLSEIERKELELEENLHKEMTWFEKAKLQKEIHELKQQIHGKAIAGAPASRRAGQTVWKLEDTARELGTNITDLSQNIALVEAAETLPKLAEFISRRQALKMLAKLKETAILSELARRDKLAAGTSLMYTLHSGDAIQYLKDSVADETIDMVIYDPPWGIDADTFLAQRGFSIEKANYDDTQDKSRSDAKKLVPELFRVMKPNTHMYVFFGLELENYFFWYNLLANPFQREKPEPEECFNVRNIPLFWIKESGGFTDYEARFMPRYESVMFCSKGLRRLSRPTSDVFEYKRPPSIERRHPQQKPVSLLQDWISLSTVPNEIVLDPCMGSGSSIVAATLIGRRSVGCENNVDTFNKAKEWIGGVNYDEIKENLVNEAAEKIGSKGE